MKAIRQLVLLIPLLLLTACHSGQRREMLALLDEADSLNRTYAQLPADSLLRRAADFFDRHGSRNEQVRAHYLLGCAYRDQGQAPEALQAYQDAIDRADTIHGDLHRLMAVYGQIIDLYDSQNLPDEELEVSKIYQRYALILGDTMSYIRNIELSAKAYILKGDTVKMLDVLNTARGLYLKHGHEKEAVALFGPIINNNIKKGEYSTAKRLLEVYESQSGLFDSEGNICAGREVFYYIRGSYYLGIQEFSLAEADFSKLLEYGLEVDGYRGRLALYDKLNKSDSVYKYARLLEDATEARSNKMRTETVKRISALYQYQSFQRKAEQSARKVRKAQQTTLVVIALGTLFCIACLVYYRRYREHKKMEIKQLFDSYSKANEDYLRLIEEVETLRTDYRQLEDQKKSEVEDLRHSLDKYERRWQSVSRRDKEVAMLNSGIVRQFHEKASGNVKASKVSDYEWQKLLFQFQNSMAAASIIMEDGRKRLSVPEMRAFVLLILGFKNSELLALLSCSPQRITNIKSIINEKLYNDPLSSTLLDNIKKDLAGFV